jgi:Ni/Fe-hydrogenase subunit HybB-like protein
MNAQALPVGGNLWTRSYKILAGLSVLALLLILRRLFLGLGASTALSDGYPWGIWIAFDVVVGTAIGCGGYALAILVYILNKGQYQSLVRSAVLTSAMGYTLAGVAASIDVGRYWNLPKLPLMVWDWNLHSVLLEVGLCIGAYTLVLWIEMAPPIFEVWREGKNPRLKNIAVKTLPKLEKAMVYILAAGLLLPTMHQSSLGTLMMLAGDRLHPLWQTPLLPLLFLLSVVGMGFAVVVCESVLSSWFLKRKYETELLARLGKITAGITIVFLILRAGDLMVRNAFTLAFTSRWMSVFFWIETLLFVIPCFKLLEPRVQSNPGRLLQQGLLLLGGGALFRLDTYLIGFKPGLGWGYFPSIGEMFVTLGIISFEIMVYIYFIRRFPILSAAEPRSAAAQAH